MKVTGWLVAMLVALGPAGALAQAKRKVVRLDQIELEGRIQKPQAFYILQRSNLNYQGVERVESFLQKIQQSVEKEPF